MESQLSAAWLPPGQTATEKFPVVGESAPAPGLDARHWRLAIDGLVERPLDLSLAELRRGGLRERRADLHCVTGWSRQAVSMAGIPLAELLTRAGVARQARYVRFIAHSTRAHDTSLPLPLAQADTWLVLEMDGAPLAAEHGGPLRTVTPGRYFYKSLKWLVRIELLAVDRLGYWERESAYHNQADPWREQRFDQARTARAEDVRALRAAEDFSAWRGHVVLRARLGGWQPRARDLRGVQLKYCSLRHARLAGVDFSGANLSLSNFEGADLRGCDFTGADLEGASFAGADLRGARLLDVALTATRFFRDFPGGQRLAARVEGMQLARARGLLEDQAAFLRAWGVAGV
jgi:DMSO/TMAO reductase YedYZ molybdopterin-dependent catalytic subunit